MRNAGMIIGVLGALTMSFFIGRLAWQYNNQAQAMSARMDALNVRLIRTTAENKLLEEDQKYLNNPENLEKEVKYRGNWRKADEKMIIVVPGAATSATSSAR
jgi:hypothetical protein